MICTACDYNTASEVTWYDTLILVMPALSLNNVGSNSKGHTGRKYRTARNKYTTALRTYRANMRPASKFRRIYFTRFWGAGKRAYDYGNLVGGFKPLLDSIVKSKLLVDDSPKWCAEYYRQEKSPDGKDYIVVALEEIE